MVLKILRVAAILGALWSLLVTVALLLMGAAFSMTDRFNGPHTPTMAGIVLLEIGLLFVLWHAYRLRPWAWMALLLWFVVASGLLTRPGGLSDWLGGLVSLLMGLAPITLTMILLAVHTFTDRPSPR